MRFRLMGLSLIIMLASAVTALAQVGRIEGKVVGKQADGQTVPVVGAQVDIIRTDIKGNYTVKTDKKGEYIHAGVPYVGTYTITVSAPGWAPSFATGVRPERPPRQDFELVPGDGRRLTIEDVNKYVASSGGPGAGAPGAPAVDPKALEEAKKREDEARKASENFEQMKLHFENGNKLFNEKNFEGAANEYKQAAALDATQDSIFNNLSAALNQVAVAKFNSGARDAAQPLFKEAADAGRKATQLKPENIAYHESLAGILAILGARFGDPEAMAEAAVEYGKVAQAQEAVGNKEAASMAYAKLGDSLYDGGKLEESKAAFEKALVLTPTNARALLGQVKVLVADPNADANTFREAITMSKKAKDAAKPNSAEAKTAEDMVRDLEATIAAMEESQKANESNKGGRRKRP